MEIEQKWFSSGKSGSFRAIVVVLGQRGCIRANWLYSGKSGCIRAKEDVIEQKWL